MLMSDTVTTLALTAGSLLCMWLSAELRSKHSLALVSVVCTESYAAESSADSSYLIKLVDK